MERSDRNGWKADVLATNTKHVCALLLRWPLARLPISLAAIGSRVIVFGAVTEVAYCDRKGSINLTEQAEENLDDSPIILRVDTAARSALSAVLCGAFGGAMGYISIASYIHAPGFKPMGLSALILGLLLSIFCLWASALNAWRFFGPDYDAVIGPDGLTLHPSVSSRLIRWDEVSASRAVQRWISRIGNRTVIELEFTNRVRSLVMPFGSKRVSIVQGRPSYPREMKDVARLIRKYRLAAGWHR